MIDRAAISEALFDEKERAQVTLNSIGDAVISTDVKGRVTYINIVAEQLTGWSRAEALGRPLGGGVSDHRPEYPRGHTQSHGLGDKHQ